MRMLLKLLRICLKAGLLMRYMLFKCKQGNGSLVICVGLQFN